MSVVTIVRVGGGGVTVSAGGRRLGDKGVGDGMLQAMAASAKASMGKKILRVISSSTKFFYYGDNGVQVAPLSLVM